MRLVCAWCEHEGRPAEMGVREPREDPTATHGLCLEHSTALVRERRTPGGASGSPRATAGRSRDRPSTRRPQGGRLRIQRAQPEAD
jgi:hypothetical protein